MNLSDVEYYVVRLIALHSKHTSEEEKHNAQKRIDLFVERELAQKQLKDRYWELKCELNDLIDRNPQLKELE
ncbi:MAG: hypothetical protein WCG14_06180 [Chlamydiia bacterium]|jgi:hypothetical protein